MGFCQQIEHPWAKIKFPGMRCGKQIIIIIIYYYYHNHVIIRQEVENLFNDVAL